MSRKTVAAKLARGVWPSSKEILELTKIPALRQLISKAFYRLNPIGVSYSPSPRAKYVSFRLKDPKKFDKRSFRRVPTDGTQLTVACPVNKWDPKRPKGKQCKAATQAQNILIPKVRVFGAIARYLRAEIPRVAVAANPKGKYRKNPLLMTVGLNPPKLPFRPGQKISIKRFENWLYKNAPREMVEEYEATKAKYNEFHLNKPAKEILVDNIDFGDGVEGTKFFYNLGKAKHSVYKVPKHSGKHFKGEWIHKWKTPPMQLADATGRAIVLPLKGTARIEDGWMHG